MGKVSAKRQITLPVDQYQTMILVTDVVLVETILTLKGKKYQLGKPELIGVIMALLEEPSIFFEDNQVIWRALNDYRKADTVNGK